MNNAKFDPDRQSNFLIYFTEALLRYAQSGLCQHTAKGAFIPDVIWIERLDLKGAYELALVVENGTQIRRISRDGVYEKFDAKKANFFEAHCCLTCDQQMSCFHFIERDKTRPAKNIYGRICPICCGFDDDWREIQYLKQHLEVCWRSKDTSKRNIAVLANLEHLELLPYEASLKSKHGTKKTRRKRNSKKSSFSNSSRKFEWRRKPTAHKLNRRNRRNRRAPSMYSRRFVVLPLTQRMSVKNRSGLLLDFRTQQKISLYRLLCRWRARDKKINPINTFIWSNKCMNK